MIFKNEIDFEFCVVWINMLTNWGGRGVKIRQKNK